MPIQRPSWLPSYIPELQGLRGIAVLAVVFYHCHPRFEHTFLYKASLWGWAGVNLFFVLSGFLITSILLESRNESHYFRNFYARRALRIWPVYVLVLLVCYLNAPWFVGQPVFEAFRTAPWWAYLLFIQNLFHLNIPPAINQTWSLAIEEQYYFLWAPVVRFLERPWMLGLLLIAAFCSSPLFDHRAWVVGIPTHTLIHLDGIAMGSMLAIALYRWKLSRRTWLVLGIGAFVLGSLAAATFAGGTRFLDAALAIAFGGAVLTCIAATGGRSPIHLALSRGPLAYYGKISYGLYMTHIGTFVYFGWVDARLNPYGIPGNFAIIAFRLVATTVVATLLWYGFESRILRLKRHFQSPARERQKQQSFSI